MRWLKALTQIIHGRTQGLVQFLLPNTRFDYAKEVGDGLGSNVVMAPILWVGRSFPEAKLSIKRGDDVLEDHAMMQLIEKPNAFYCGDDLWLATLLSIYLDGNAYWFKVKPTGRGPMELWYIPHWFVEPKWENNDFISYYEYRPSGGIGTRIDPQDLIHFRFGLDPRNVRKGLHPLGSAIREVYTDNEAANFSASILRNHGIGGLVISPEKDVTVSTADLQMTKEYLQDQFGGDRRGKAIVMGAATKIQEFGFSPDKMNLSSLRNISEERVCSLMGIPSAVVGFGSGLEQTKVGATMNELRRLAWSNGILPMQRIMAGTLTRALLPEMGGKPNDKVFFDVSEVSAMQEDLVQEAERISKLVAAGIMTVAEARGQVGLEVEPQHEIFLRPFSSIETPADGSEPEPTPAPVPGATNQPPKGSKSSKRMTRLQTRIARGMEAMRKRMEPEMRRKLINFFDSYGKEVERAWIESNAKADEEELRVEVLFSTLGLPAKRSQIRGIFGSHYSAVSVGATRVLNDVGLAVDLPDNVQLEILSMGASRSQIVNLEIEAKQKALDIIREAREEGLGVPETARRLRDSVPAGPWTSSKIRAEIIARTETRFAQTESAFRAYQEIDGVTSMMILDARLGDTDQDCMDLNGEVVDFAEARRLLATEHPNGTRDIVPVFG